MMKKLIMLLTICMMCLLAVSASAAGKNDEALLSIGKLA